MSKEKIKNLNEIIREISNQNSKNEKLLSPLAMTTEKSKGRLNHEESNNLRSPYQIDRDRIIHTNAFRRLNIKAKFL